MKLSGLHTSRIAKALAVGLVVAIALAAAAFVWTLRTQEIHKWEKQTEVFSIVLAENTSQQMDFAYTALENISERIQDRWSVNEKYLIEQLSTTEFHQFLTEKVALFPAIEVISVLDADGNVINTSRSFPGPDYNLADRDYFQAQRDRPSQGVYLGKPVRSKTTGDWIFFLSHRLTGSDGEFLGVVTLGMSPNFYADFFKKLSVDSHASVSLLRADFTYLARWPENDSVMGKKDLTGSSFHLIEDLQKKSGIVIAPAEKTAGRGRIPARMSAIQSLDKYPLIINLSVDEELYLADWLQISIAIAIVSSAAIAAVIAAFRVLIQLFLQRESDMQVMVALKSDADVINRNQTGLLQSLTEQQKVSKESSDRLQAIFQNAADGIIMIDADGTVDAINPAAVAIYGYPAMEVVGKSNHLFSVSGQPALLELAMAQPVFRETGRLRLEIESVRKDGGLFPADFAISEYYLAGKRQLIIIVRDISERRKIEKMKNEFISTVSHELRTPLTSIRGALGLLAGGAMGDLPEKIKPLLLMAHKNCLSLTRLINDLLDIQKIEAGKMDFSIERLNVSALLHIAQQSNFSVAQALAVHLTIEEDAAYVASLEVAVDNGRFAQVMANLISNACKYTPAGGVVRLVVTCPTPTMVRVAVIDQGSGVPESFRDRIFEKFSQADSSDTRARGGTGLGLAISKVLIQQMHGDIGYWNQAAELGGGAVFYVDLPIALK
ncbi:MULTISPECIES: ATP-binding protein [unclassified Undibacterium]|uniref:ATP-binding protein n=1 Tax=unclassified Undibacterium TaxID=2630295 RepID=UPI002AC8ACA2|nr:MULTISPECIES: ATP-binding protein [unclassified Undibacterium]MEB0140601.1 ATP-binding protein [Undibacterium sp. CCC2.1]MEB0173493.1 ATP-binding protein [Undibacterium sp. CCC1.1]MEB0177605.1 ATP-binding protein [Undibacterium sp. CCC3.4]MEB0216779.1 ATP-binding protein [Undibacterium sp. 5I2]WPX44671.1 ATP-binding protein [Undibacterium sp. CCC3.4]